MPTYRNTPEQEAIIAAIRDGRNVGVQVCAGAGKSRRLLVTMGCCRLRVDFHRARDTEASS